MALTTRRKADREKMAKTLKGAVEALAADGYESRVEEYREAGFDVGPERITLKISMARNARVSVRFEANTRQRENTWVLNFGFEYPSDEFFNAAFSGRKAHSKATHVAYGFESMMDFVLQTIQRAHRGEIFDDAAKEREIRVNGETAAQRVHRMRAYDALPEVIAAKEYRDRVYALPASEQEAHSEALAEMTLKARDAAMKAGLIKQLYRVGDPESPRLTSERLKHLMRAAGYPSGRHVMSPETKARIEKDWKVKISA